MDQHECISCIRDGSTGICRDIKDKKSRELIAEISNKLNETIDAVNSLSGLDGGHLATDEDIQSLETEIIELNNRLNNFWTAHIQIRDRHDNRLTTIEENYATDTYIQGLDSRITTLENAEPPASDVKTIKNLGYIDFMDNIVELLKNKNGIVGCFCKSKNETNQNLLSSLVQYPRFLILNNIDYGMGVNCTFKYGESLTIYMDLPSYDFNGATNNMYFTQYGANITPQAINDLVFDIIYM